jgi:ABC-2 type transport system permease protein
MVQRLSGQGIYVVLLRELKRFARARARIIGSVVQSFMFLGIFALGFGGSFGGITGALSFLAPGIIGMALLFGSIFTGVSVVFDRQFGFMKEILVAPVSRTSIILGKILGGAITAAIQGAMLLVVSALMGAFVPSLLLAVGAALAFGVMLLVSAGFVGIGVAIGSALNDFHAFQLISTFLMWPLFLLSGVFFPIEAVPAAMQIAMMCDPMFYGVDLLRWCLVGAGTSILGPLGWLIDLGAITGFTALMVIIGTALFSRAQV